MKHIVSIIVLITLFSFVSCENSEEYSKTLDRQVPECKTLTITANGQTVVVDDLITTKILWGFVPKVNLEPVVLPTATVTKGSKLTLSVVLSDNVALKTVDMAYSPWLAANYINFSNPVGDIPLNPKSFTYTVEIAVPLTAVSTPWLENFYFNDGSPMKITQPYHKIVITVVDINQNKRILPVYVKVQ